MENENLKSNIRKFNGSFMKILKIEKYITAISKQGWKVFISFVMVLKLYDANSHAAHIVDF